MHRHRKADASSAALSSAQATGSALRLQEELAALRQQGAGQGLPPDEPGVQNVAHRQSAEQELRESEQCFRKLFHLVPASIGFTRKSDHVFLEVNRGFEAKPYSIQALALQVRRVLDGAAAGPER